MTDSSRLKADIKALVGTPASKKALPERAATPAIGAGIGTARPKAATGGGSGSSTLIGDLTEADYTSREWHPVQTLTSSDGFFVFEQRYLKKITLTDGAGAVHSLILDDKP